MHPVVRAQVPCHWLQGEDLEQNFRDAFFNAKLGAAWEAGHQWAAIDYNGLPMMEGAERQRELDSVSFAG